MNDFLEDKVWILQNHESWKLIVFDIFPRGMDINIFILEPNKKLLMNLRILSMIGSLNIIFEICYAYQIKLFA